MKKITFLILIVIVFQGCARHVHYYPLKISDLGCGEYCDKMYGKNVEVVENTDGSVTKTYYSGRKIKNGYSIFAFPTSKERKVLVFKDGRRIDTYKVVQAQKGWATSCVFPIFFIPFPVPCETIHIDSCYQYNSKNTLICQGEEWY